MSSRSGPLTGNGYLYFLRDFRRKNNSISASQIVTLGAQAWDNLPCAVRDKYFDMSCHMKKSSKNKYSKKMNRCEAPKKKMNRCEAPKKKMNSCEAPKKKMNSCEAPKQKMNSCEAPKRKMKSCEDPKKKKDYCEPPKKKMNRDCKPEKSCKEPTRSKSACNKDKKAKPKCSMPGPVTNNAYLNFLRYFRKCNCGLSPQDIFRKGAKKWCSLTSKEKLRFEVQACQVSKSARKKNSKICREAAQRRREANAKKKRKCAKS